MPKKLQISRKKILVRLGDNASQIIPCILVQTCSMLQKWPPSLSLPSAPISLYDITPLETTIPGDSPLPKISPEGVVGHAHTPV